MLQIPFVSLEQIENNSWWNKTFSDDEKLRLRSIIQVDIVSKIMMYIEDLAVLSESFIERKDFYELVVDESINIGRLKYLDEIRPMDEIGNLDSLQKVDPKELSLGKTLVENLTTQKFDPGQYSDTYAKELEKLIEAKSKGQNVVA